MTQEYMDGPRESPGFRDVGRARASVSTWAEGMPRRLRGWQMLQSAARVMAHDVFISYSSKDKVIADAVCARLEARGIRCWIAPRDVQPGAPYGEEIIDGIHGSRAMVLVLTANANASPHIPKEVERAVSRGVSIIPLRVEDVLPAKSLDYFISSVHWLDAITPPLESHLESLATTIRTLLPEGAQKAIPRVETQAAPAVGAGAPVIPGAPGRAKPKWLLPAIALAVVALAGAGWYFLGKAPGAGNSPVAVVPTQPGMSQPSMGQPGMGQPRMTEPGSTRPQPAHGGPVITSPGVVSPRLGMDPIIGCWHWMNNAAVVINADGTMTAGPFTARWRLANPGRRVYTFSWPEAVDSVSLSPDGSGLSGGNQYGVPLTATRVAPGQGLTGAWRWYNGVIVNILPDGTFSAQGTRGRWQSLAGGAYTLTWPGPVDTVTMSADHGQVSGANQYGFRISGTKAAVCGG
jgi:hypothetical protein